MVANIESTESRMGHLPIVRRTAIVIDNLDKMHNHNLESLDTQKP